MVLQIIIGKMLQECFLNMKQAVATMANKADVGVILSSQLAQENQANREYLLNVMSIIRFLVRQALPLRGDGDETPNSINCLYYMVKAYLKLKV